MEERGINEQIKRLIMEFPEEIIQETGLNEEQLGKISEYTDTILAEKEKEW